jgi:thiamine biosynthesis lipoprotein
MKQFCFLKSQRKFQFISLLIIFSIACNETPFEVKLQGYAQGTTYNITYNGNTKSLQTQIDSLLHAIDQSMSTYKANSIISKFNNSDSGVVIDQLFLTVYNKSIQIFNETNGIFDPTIAPLAEAWGFGKTQTVNADSTIIDSILKYVGLEKIKLRNNNFLFKPNSNIQLDFNAIAQGYSVDLIASLLEKNKIENYMVELGGELRTKGKNAQGDIWKIGIDKPKENNTERELASIIELADNALATSGNYRKFYIKNGKKYAHTLNPKTGFPAENNLLSATVITEKCIDADAYATAFMVMGVEKTIEFIQSKKKISVYLIYTNNKREIKEFVSEELKDKLKNI